jgi:hypothetical protein
MTLTPLELRKETRIQKITINKTVSTQWNYLDKIEI